MFNRTILAALTVSLSLNVSAITLDEFSERLVESHPYFVQLSLAEKTSLLNQKSLSTYADWNIKAGASETFTGGEDVASRLYKDLYATKYEIGATRKVENSGASINLKHSLTRNDKDSNATHSNLFSVDYVRPMLQNKDGLNDRLNLDLASMRCVGYRQAWNYFEGIYSKKEMVEKAIIATRQLCKRQSTWLRNENEALILKGLETNQAINYLQEHDA